MEEHRWVSASDITPLFCKLLKQDVCLGYVCYMCVCVCVCVCVCGCVCVRVCVCVCVCLRVRAL